VAFRYTQELNLRYIVLSKQPEQTLIIEAECFRGIWYTLSGNAIPDVAYWMAIRIPD